MQFKFSLKPKLWTRGIAISALGLLLAGPSLAFNVTSGITGWWEQVAQENHGLVIATSQLPDGSQTGVIFWAHYDESGNPTWLLGQGDLSDNLIYANLYQVSGISFMQAAGSVPNAEQRVGTLSISFNDCKTGSASFSTDLPSVGNGSFNIERLTTLPGVSCSGGISDDIPPSTATERFVTALTANTAYPGARGRALWVLGGGSATFDIEIDHVASGDYQVLLGGESKGVITARMDPFDSDAEGEIEFYSPQRSYYPLLDFDPRGQTLEIVNASGTVVLSATLPVEGDSGDIDYGPVKGEVKIRQRLTNASTYGNAYAVAEFEQDDDGYTSFEVDVDNIPSGTYTLAVDTVAKGTIQVWQDGSGTEGEIEFYSPARAGYAVLDFDPRGALIEILDGQTSLFFGDFPGTATSPSPNPGEDSGPGDDDGPGDNDDGPGDNDDGPGDNDDGPGHDDNDDDHGDNDDGHDDDDNEGYSQDIRLRLDNQGVYALGRAMAEFSVEHNRAEFEVDLDNVPEGNYALVVDQVNRGTIRVYTEYEHGQTETEGEIEFSEYPDDHDEILLDFEVRGATIEIFEGETLIFSGVFPAG